MKEPIEWEKLRPSYVPNQVERTIGVWVDRIFFNSSDNYDELLDAEQHTPYRILGLYTISYIIEGRGTFYSPPTGNVSFSKGACIIQFPDIPHSYRSVAVNGEWKRCTVSFNGPIIDQLRTLDYISHKHPVVNDKNQVLYDFYKELSRRKFHQTKEAVLWKATQLIRLIYYLHQAFQRDSTNHVIFSRINEITDFIDANVNQSLSPPEIAEKFFISYSHLRNIFKAETGVSITEYINRQKIAMAKEYLTNSDMTIKEIAYIVGYADEHYFMRVFKKFTGTTPNLFRKIRM